MSFSVFLALLIRISPILLDKNNLNLIQIINFMTLFFFFAIYIESEGFNLETSPKKQ